MVWITLVGLFVFFLTRWQPMNAARRPQFQYVESIALDAAIPDDVTIRRT